MIIRSFGWICFCLALTLVAEARGQRVADEGAAQWRRVQALPAGEPVEVRPLKGKKVKGSVVSATDDALTITADDGQRNTPRADIKEVKIKRTSPNLKRGGIGAAIGAASGVIFVVILDGALTDGDGVAEDAAAILGAVGAAIGFLAGVISHGYVTIYKVR